MPRRLNKNWITAYFEATEPITEAPSAYTMWSAISVISAVLKKKVWIDRGPYNVYPNQYIVLVGPPGVGKGTAIHPAHAFIKDFKPTLANYLSDRITAEKIIKNLEDGFQTQAVVAGNIIAGKESTAIIQATELSTFISSSDWMTSFLCDAWDRGEFEYDTKNKGTHKVKDMCVSLIGACVPDYIRRLNNKMQSTDMINGGFTARTIFVYATEPSKKLPWPMALKNTKSGPGIIHDLRHDLEQIANLKGEYTFTQDAIDTWTPWYLKKTQQDSDSDVVSHFRSRQANHVLKVAMCLAASHRDTLLIDRWELQTAMHLVQNVLNTLDNVFRGVGDSSLAEASARLQSYIERKGICSRVEIIRDNHRHITPEDIDRILQTLETIGVCKSYTQNSRLYYSHINLSPNGNIIP